MWRNFLTELTWSWAFVRNVVELFKSKNFKEAQKTLNEWYAFCMNEGLSESLNVLAKHKLIPAKAVPELVRLADIVVNVAFAFVT